MGLKGGVGVLSILLLVFSPLGFGFVTNNNLYFPLRTRIISGCSANRPQRTPPSQARMTSTPANEHARVVFIRHGESLTNKERKFVSWIDSALTEKGVREAEACGKALREAGVDFDVVYTSWLKRAIKTAWITLEEMDAMHIPVHPSIELNERFVGCLVGETMESAVQKFGAEQVRVWRTTADIRPNDISKDSPFFPGNDPKYSSLNPSDLPVAESLLDVRNRVSEFWQDEIVPCLRDRKRVAVVAHENTLRALFYHIDPNIPPSEILQFEVPRATPIAYSFDAQMRVLQMQNSFSPLSGRVLGPAPSAGADSSALIGKQELSMDAEAGFR